MNTLDALNEYLRKVERALRVLAFSRGAAAVTAVALGATIALAVVIAHAMLTTRGLVIARGALFISVGAAFAFAIILPLLRLNRRNAARRAEQAYPQFEQRLLTLGERDANDRDPFLVLLASEAGEVARDAIPSTIARSGRIAAFAASAAGGLAILLWLILAGPGVLGDGASLLWAGTSKSGSEGLYAIDVQPGNAAVRRKSDQVVTARLLGFESPDVRMFARFRGATRWEEAPMLPRDGASGYEFLFAALADDVEYYVQSRGIRSATYKLSALDLPGIRRFKVVYHYPRWTGLSDTTDEPGGDIRAVEGTTAELNVEFDKPIASAAVVMDDGASMKLEGQGSTLRAEIPVQKDGTYHFAALEGNQIVRLSEDFFIEARKDSPPMVKVVRPGRDARVSPIEEVPVVVEAEDDFGLQEITLHYSVNGGAEQTVNMLPRPGAKQASGKALLYLEDFKMSPGDVVGIYATARDARNITRTDMFFIEAQPYERDYSQAQQSGGGVGGGGDDQEQQIAARQKEIIAATWNQIKDTHPGRNAADDARFLSEVQSKLRGQAQSMAERAQSRQLAGTNETFQAFVKELEEAAKEMGAASDKLKAQNFREALPPEQRALQHLMRAEMTIKEIQVAFGNRNAGQGGGGAARDLENLFDLELDTEKNQYETGQQMGSADERQRDIDEALQRLEELARRQQELAQQQKQNQQVAERRWQQEQLRREAEELRRRMEEMSRQSSSSSSSQQASSSGQQSSGSSSSASERQLRQAFDRLSRATDDMRQAASNPEQREAAARRASEQLQQARDTLRGMRQAQSASQLDELGGRADRLAQQQRQFADKMRQAFGPQSLADPRGQNVAGVNREQNQRLAGEKEQMARELERLESDVQRAARDMQGSQPAASGKLREGLGEIQQNEVKLRMKYAANWIRQGRGGFVAAGEAITTAGISKLRDDIRDAQKAIDQSAQDGKQTGDAGEKTEQALRRLEQAREALERSTKQAQSGNGSKTRQGQGQQHGQGQRDQGQQQGAQAGDQQGSSEQASSLSQEAGGAASIGGPGSALRQTMRDLSELRQQFGSQSPIGQDIGGAIREIARMQQLPLAGPEMDARIQREVLPALEQIELQLRRKLDEAKGGPKNPSDERIPPGYADRVAEYYRRLSKTK